MPDTNDLLTKIERALDGSEPFQSCLGLTIRHFGADSGTLHTRRGDLLELVASSAGIPEGVLEKIRRIPIGKGMAGLAAERAEPVSTCNLQTDTTGDVRPGARPTGLAGSICVPVFRGEEVVGALGIGNRAEREFTPEEIELLLEAGRCIGSRSAG